jgi:hypothetical protein
MLGFIRRAWRPIASIGEKISNIFKIGRKAEVISDLRNIEKFENLAPAGLRVRSNPPSDVLAPRGDFYGNMDGYLKSYRYPT